MIKADDGDTFTILNKNLWGMIGKKVKVAGSPTNSAGQNPSSSPV